MTKQELLNKLRLLYTHSTKTSKAVNAVEVALESLKTALAVEATLADLHDTVQRDGIDEPTPTTPPAPCNGCDPGDCAPGQSGPTGS